MFDLVIIGAGPGGYTSAIRASQLGLKVALVEKRKTLGGTCLNIGCIPSKALLESSEYYVQSLKDFKNHGIEIKSVKLNLKKMMERKDQVVQNLTHGVEFLMKKNKVQTFFGHGQIKSKNEVQVKYENGKSEILKAQNILLATGSVPNTLPSIEVDEKNIVSSTGALSLSHVPAHMVVIGGGYIGLELGSVWNRLGSKVTVIEFGPKIAATMDSHIGKLLHQSLEKQGLKFELHSKVTQAQVQRKEGPVNLSIESVKDGSTKKMKANVVLVATGRRPLSENLGLEALNVQKDEHHFLKVNEHYQTSEPHIYAIGDLIPGPMLAHKAEEEGVAVAEHLAGRSGHVNYLTVPGVIYTWPEVASVGYTEDQLKTAEVPYSSGRFPFAANGRAQSLGFTEGQVKILAHKDTDQILGVHIIGPRASDIISEAVVAMEFGASSEDLARTFHAHPTLSETLREAALDVDNRARQM